jgi:hypothetical protein
MPLAKDLVGAGFSPGQARGVNGLRNTAISAAGTNQATATALTATINYVSTVAANSGVICPNASHGDDMWIFNGGANVLAVYPPVGSKFNAIATNGAINLGLNTGLLVKKVTDTQWIANLSA